MDVRPRRPALLLLFAFVGVGALLYCADRTINGDVYLLVASGREISRLGLVNVDPFPTIEHGMPWLNQQWLTELLFFRIVGAIGFHGLALVYAAVLSGALTLLLWTFRWVDTVAPVVGSVLFVPPLAAVIHPRGAGLGLACFVVLSVVIARALRRRGRIRLRLAVVPPLFILWANLHGSFLAGLLLLALVTTGLGLESFRNRSGYGNVLLLAATTALSTAAVFATPLGLDMVRYLASFAGSGIAIASTEWAPAWRSPVAAAYVVAATGAVCFVWSRSTQPRSLVVPLVASGFLVFALVSIRNLPFLGAAAFFCIGMSTGPGRRKVGVADVKLSRLVGVGAAALGVVAAAVIVGPPKPAPHLKVSLADYALAHPPAGGRIASIGGTSSYILWRNPNQGVVVDGWLEHFTASDLRATYAILDGDPSAAKYVRRWNVGGIITKNAEGVSRLSRLGFRTARRDPNGWYLVLRSVPR